MNDQASCPVCLASEAEVVPRPDGADAVVVECPRCGKFQMSRTLVAMLGAASEGVADRYAPRWVLSAAVRNQYEQGESLELRTNTVETLLEVARKPTDPFESINLLLRHIQSEVSTPAQAVSFELEYDYPLVYARDPEEFEYYITKAQELNLIELGPDNQGYRLGLEGWRRLEELEKNRAQSDQAFVAMWFDEEMTSAYTKGIEPALNESGYDPIRIDMEEHNEKIDDRIIAEIRQSGLVVTDFTGQRGGVYYEAGFAKGLGIPVIWTCQENAVENLHFDTRQYNHIVWKNPEGLRSQLVDRIGATLA